MTREWLLLDDEQLVFVDARVLRALVINDAAALAKTRVLYQDADDVRELPVLGHGHKCRARAWISAPLPAFTRLSVRHTSDERGHRHVRLVDNGNDAVLATAWLGDDTATVTVRVAADTESRVATALVLERALRRQCRRLDTDTFSMIIDSAEWSADEVLELTIRGHYDYVDRIDDMLALRRPLHLHHMPDPTAWPVGQVRCARSRCHAGMQRRYPCTRCEAVYYCSERCRADARAHADVCPALRIS